MENKSSKRQTLVLLAACAVSAVFAIWLAGMTADPALKMLARLSGAKPDIESIHHQNSFWKAFNTGEVDDKDGYGMLGMIFRIHLNTPEPKYRDMTFGALMSAANMVATQEEKEALNGLESEDNPAKAARAESVKKWLALQRKGTNFLELVLSDKERFDAALAGKPVPLLPEPSQ
ncbi:MAG: hypothetical protein AAB692_04540 [Patescibacteria group bacterium]